MDLDIAIKTMLDAQSKLRTKDGINNPSYMSEQMMRLAQATGAAEIHLADLEKDYEVQLAKQLHRFLVTEGTSATNAEKRVKIELGELKGQLAYLSRLVSSAWKQISTIQSRYNHLQKESVGQV